MKGSPVHEIVAMRHCPAHGRRSLCLAAAKERSNKEEKSMFHYIELVYPVPELSFVSCGHLGEETPEGVISSFLPANLVR